MSNLLDHQLQITDAQCSICHRQLMENVEELARQKYPKWFDDNDDNDIYAICLKHMKELIQEMETMS